jgi:Zn-dependent protease with chaperone function
MRMPIVSRRIRVEFASAGPGRIPPISRLGIVFLSWLATQSSCLARQAEPAEFPEVSKLLSGPPLSEESWRAWRDVYVRFQFQVATNEPVIRDFEDRINHYFLQLATAANGALPEAHQNDPIAWIALSQAYRADARASGAAAMNGPIIDRADDALRKAIELGDPRAYASFSLAWSIVLRIATQGSNTTLSTRTATKLGEADELLAKVERVSPEADLNGIRGFIAELRGDRSNAARLFQKALEKSPDSEIYAVKYLNNALITMNRGTNPMSLTEPLISRFPESYRIVASHAGSLYFAGRFREAAETLDKALQLDPDAARFLGVDQVRMIEEGRNASPKLAQAIADSETGRYDSACNLARQALQDDPNSVLAARVLSSNLATKMSSFRESRGSLVTRNTAKELEDLSHRFPKDGEIQVDLAAALYVANRPIDAAQALARAEELGAKPDQVLGARGVEAIRIEGDEAKTTRFVQFTAFAVVGTAAGWILAMFAMGAILAIATPRVPRTCSLTGDAKSGRERWLERFYLLVLSLGLIVFYATVPLVTLGLLAITLALLVLMVAIRFLHLGILHRGFWASWNVLRCALMGDNREVLGIKATEEEHPRLFDALRNVAARLDTAPVDTVYLTPSSAISVRQEGSGPFGLLGRRKRVLEVGISTLPILTEGEFHSILAHEYGHFSHNDTFYSRFIFQVSSTLARSLAVMQMAGGFMNYVNPFYWFWWLYLRAYTLLATGFSRSREFLADRRSAAAYGKQAFVSGLTKVSVDGVLFESTIYANVEHLLAQGKAFSNAFDAFRSYRDEPDVAGSRERYLADLRGRKPKWFDTHPTFAERLSAIDAFPNTDAPLESAPAIELLNNPRDVEAKLTSLLTEAVYNSISNRLAQDEYQE